LIKLIFKFIWSIRQELPEYLSKIFYRYQLHYSINSNKAYFEYSLSCLNLSSIGFSEEYLTNINNEFEQKDTPIPTLGGYYRFSVNGIAGIAKMIPGETKEANSNIDFKLIDRITFHCKSLLESKKLKIYLESLANNYDENERYNNRVHFFDYGSWHPSPINISKRSFSTVFFDEKTKQDIKSRFKLFIESESIYEDKQLPYHYGLVLHGPPGTGKTSVILALANEFNLRVHIPDAATLQSGKNLLEAISTVPKNSLLVIEDMDTIAASAKRTGEHKDTSHVLSMLLNGLDGIVTPHGLIVIITTNHIENIDPALLRPGRIDHNIEMTYLTQANLLDMLNFYFPNVKHKLDISNKNITPAEITSIVSSYISDSKTAMLELNKFINLK
jgi:hypothetical protein